MERLHLTSRHRGGRWVPVRGLDDLHVDELILWGPGPHAAPSRCASSLEVIFLTRAQRLVILFGPAFSEMVWAICSSAGRRADRWSTRPRDPIGPAEAVRARGGHRPSRSRAVRHRGAVRGGGAALRRGGRAGPGVRGIFTVVCGMTFPIIVLPEWGPERWRRPCHQTYPHRRPARACCRRRRSRLPHPRHGLPAGQRALPCAPRRWWPSAAPSATPGGAAAWRSTDDGRPDARAAQHAWAIARKELRVNLRYPLQLVTEVAQPLYQFLIPALLLGAELRGRGSCRRPGGDDRHRQPGRLPVPGRGGRRHGGHRLLGHGLQLQARDGCRDAGARPGSPPPAPRPSCSGAPSAAASRRSSRARS